MKTNKNQCRIKYNQARDAFDLLISTDGGETWSESMSAKCFALDGDPVTEFIHMSLIGELKKAVALGYQFVY